MFADADACVVIDERMGLHALGKPHVASDDAVVADDGITAQNGGACVDDHAVADLRMAFDTLDGVAVFVGIKLFAPNVTP